MPLCGSSIDSKKKVKVAESTGCCTENLTSKVTSGCLLCILSSPECPEGKYGLNCSIACSAHCAGPINACDHVDGSCDEACDPGYIAPLCLRGKVAKLS